MAWLQGCFVGAETLSKLSNLDAVKQQLWGLQLTSKAASGDLIFGGAPYRSLHSLGPSHSPGRAAVLCLGSLLHTLWLEPLRVQTLMQQR